MKCGIFPTLREEHMLQGFENKVLRKIFAPRKDEACGKFITLHKEELHDVYGSHSSVRIVKSRRLY
jgi:hypothetical protein